MSHSGNFSCDKRDFLKKKKFKMQWFQRTIWGCLCLISSSLLWKPISIQTVPHIFAFDLDCPKPQGKSTVTSYRNLLVSSMSFLPYFSVPRIHFKHDCCCNCCKQLLGTKSLGYKPLSGLGPKALHKTRHERTPCEEKKSPSVWRPKITPCSRASGPTVIWLTLFLLVTLRLPFL